MDANPKYCESDAHRETIMTEIRITHMSKVHTAIRCDECGFETWDHVNGVAAAEAHHRETGHELYGDVGFSVWIGEKGRERNRKRMDATLGPPIQVDPAAGRKANTSWRS